MDMKRILTLLAGVSLVAGLFAATPAPAKAIATGGWWTAPDVIVATRDRNIGPVGTCSNPNFTSINAAVESLDSALTIEDHVIGICKGTYVQVESLILTDHFTFVGEGASKTVIDGSKLEYFDSENDGIIEDAFNGVTVANITFKGGGASYGGAIHTENNEDTVDTADVACYSSSFINNLAAFEGGAIYASGDIFLSRCTFRNNAATEAGGAIYGERDIIDYGSTYTLNTAADGGAVAEGGVGGGIDNTIGFYSSTFTKNSAVTGVGGAIYSDNGDTYIENSKFIGNSASVLGGAIQKDSCDAFIDLDIYATSVLNSNTEAYLVHDKCQLEISNSVFTGNSAGLAGGAVGTVGLDATTGFNIGATFTGNTFQLNRAPVGAAIIAGGFIEAGSNVFTRNSSSGIVGEGGPGFGGSVIAYSANRRATWCDPNYDITDDGDGGGNEDLDPIYANAVVDGAERISFAANRFVRNSGSNTLRLFYDGPGSSNMPDFVELTYNEYGCGGYAP
jgi:predicted outer membrane repeat protein